MTSFRLITSILVLTSICAQGQFKDQDFESEESPWVWGESLYNIRKDSIAHKGSSSMLIDGSGQVESASFVQFIPYSSKELSRFRLSGYIRYENISRFAGLFGSAQGSGNVASIVTMDFENLTGSETQWKEYSIDFIADETSEYLIIGGNLFGSGKVWFDTFHFSKVAPGNPDADSQDYLNNFLSLIKHHSLIKDSVDFYDLQSRVDELMPTIRNTRDSYAVIRYILRRLNDGHSHFKTAQEAERWKASEVIPSPRCKIILKNTGYIEIPGYSTGNPEQITLYASNLQKAIQSLEEDHIIDAWIIDLTKNSGGNAFAMLAGLAPLFPEGEMAYIVKNNSVRTPISQANGEIIYGNQIVASVPSSYKSKYQNRPVYILTSPVTGSAGELTAIALKGLRDSVVVGSKTYGLTTNTETFPLSDGAILYLANGYFADKHKTVYVKGIPPDVSSENPLLKAQEIISGN